ncbi:MAG TPA: ABC transporter permease [Bryobacteraceae bacterium]|nr:ABC transporter permease [Bryobacteraceae bacterium]
MLNDIRYAVRSLLRDRGFTTMVVLSLAVGIGANTAIFSLVNSILLRPPAYRQAEQLVGISQVVPKLAKTYPSLPINLGILAEWRQHATSFESIGVDVPASFNLTGVGEPDLLRGVRMSANFLSVLGVRPRLGRSFLDSEDATGHDAVVILTDGLWRRRFQADPGIIGRKILLDGKPNEVVGVMPPSFRFPRENSFAIALIGEPTEIFKPLGYRNEDLKLEMGDFNYWPTGRLRAGVLVSKAQAELNVVQAGISAKIPDDLNLHATLVPLVERMVGDVRRGLVLLMAAVGAVLLVLCVNLANLSLVRAAGRAHDSAIRVALGAGRSRMIRQSLVESVLLAGIGGGLGVALAYGGLRALLQNAPVDLPRLSEVHVDVRVLLFAAAIALVTGLILGVLPAWRHAAAAPYETLKSASRTGTEGRRGMRVRSVLVSLEVGLSATLLVTASLLATSFVRLMGVDKGYDVNRVVSATMSLPATKYPDVKPRAAFYQRLLERAAAIPGVQATALVSALPLQGESWIDIVAPEGDTRPLLDQPTTNVRFTSPGYFRTLRVSMAEGRDFEERDRNRKVAVISAGLARKLWPGKSAVGRKLDDHRDIMEVAGVTPDLRSTSLDKEPVNMLYHPYWERPQPASALLVRTAMDPRGMAGTLRSVIWEIDSEVPVPEIRTMQEVMDQSVAQRRFQMLLVGLFAAAALALAAFGTYGVVSYSVARRRAEVGIRIALGASQGNVLGMVVRQGMTPVFAGLLGGALAALAIGKFVASLLFQVSPRDPGAFAAASAVIALTAAAACLIPARRAARMNPVQALRFE